MSSAGARHGGEPRPRFRAWARHTASFGCSQVIGGGVCTMCMRDRFRLRIFTASWHTLPTNPASAIVSPRSPMRARARMRHAANGVGPSASARWSRNDAMRRDRGVAVVDAVDRLAHVQRVLPSQPGRCIVAGITAAVQRAVPGARLRSAWPASAWRRIGYMQGVRRQCASHPAWKPQRNAPGRSLRAAYRRTANASKALLALTSLIDSAIRPQSAAVLRNLPEISARIGPTGGSTREEPYPCRPLPLSLVLPARVPPSI